MFSVLFYYRNEDVKRLDKDGIPWHCPKEQVKVFKTFGEAFGYGRSLSKILRNCCSFKVVETETLD